MRYLTFFIDRQNKIDIHNSWLGRETIYYNGTLMSNKSSLFGATHDFEVREADETASYRIHINYKWPFRIGFDIFRNGRALILS